MAKITVAARYMLVSRSMRGTSRRRCTTALAFLVFAASISAAQSSRPTESQVKAAYLYNFGKFVTWPNDGTRNGDVFQICVIGKDPFGPVLDATVTGESIGSKKIAVERISKMQDGAGCNILFISASEAGRLPGILPEARRMHVLTVSDLPHFVERGGTIGLVEEEGRIRFEVNRNAADQSHLGLSSELLKVAVKVIANKPAGNEP